jgi:hypothetical protein
MKKNKKGQWIEDPVHAWFELSRASYAVLPRVILQSMPLEWQEKFVALMDEVDEIPEMSCPKDGNYIVLVRGKDGRFCRDGLPSYRHNYIEYKKKRKKEDQTGDKSKEFWDKY